MQTITTTARPTFNPRITIDLDSSKQRIKEILMTLLYFVIIPSPIVLALSLHALIRHRHTPRRRMLLRPLTGVISGGIGSASLLIAVWHWLH